MFVAVNERVFDPNQDKIMVILSSADIKNINIMANNDNNCYAMYPKGLDRGEANRWMERKAREVEAMQTGKRH